MQELHNNALCQTLQIWHNLHVVVAARNEKKEVVQLRGYIYFTKLLLKGTANPKKSEKDEWCEG